MRLTMSGASVATRKRVVVDFMVVAGVAGPGRRHRHSGGKRNQARPGPTSPGRSSHEATRQRVAVDFMVVAGVAVPGRRHRHLGGKRNQAGSSSSAERAKCSGAPASGVNGFAVSDRGTVFLLRRQSGVQPMIEWGLGVGAFYWGTARKFCFG